MYALQYLYITVMLQGMRPVSLTRYNLKAHSKFTIDTPYFFPDNATL